MTEVSKSFVRKCPIYDTFAIRVTEKDLPQYTINVKSKLTRLLNSLSQEQAEQITVLLIHFYFLNNPESNPFTPKNKNLPYGIKVSPSGKGFSFNFETIPIAFQVLLCKYCGIM